MIIDELLKGGPLMVPLAACSVLSLGVVIDRWRAFRRYAAVDNRSLTAQVVELTWEGKLDEAALLCAETPGPVSAVLLAGIQAYDKALRRKAESTTTVPIHVSVKEAMDDYAIHAISAVQRRFGVLSTVANAAPLIGMTGTVTGMIASFDALSSGGVNKEGVAAGIGEALVTTAAGLIVALLAVIPFNFFTAKADEIDLAIEETKAQFVDTVAQVG